MIEYFADIQICICYRTECSASRGFSQSCMPLSIYNNNNLNLLHIHICRTVLTRKEATTLIEAGQAQIKYQFTLLMYSIYLS